MDFLGFSVRMDRDLKGRPWKYLNKFPSDKAIAKIREKIRVKTRSSYMKSRRDVYPIDLKIRFLTKRKYPGLNYRKPPHISNIRRLTIVQSRGFLKVKNPYLQVIVV